MKRLTWVIGTGKEAEIFEVNVLDGACSSCLVEAVTELPPPLLAEQPDDTTHVCNPALGGCNQGYALK
jgi:hypothetical protein